MSSSKALPDRKMEEDRRNPRSVFGAMVMNKKQKAPDGSVKPFPRERFLKFIDVLRVQTRDFGMQRLNLLGSQLYILDEICKGLEEGITTFVILKARQLGASTFFLALDLFWAFENRGLLGIFATHDEGSRDQFRNQIELFLKTLPKTHRFNAETSNRLMLVLENSSMFRYLIAGSRQGTNKLGRSGGCNFLHATEVAFWGSSEDIASLNQTLSELYPSRLYIYESTANGFNHYSDMWEIAQNSPAQKAIFVGWWRNELYEFSEDHPLYLKYMPQGIKTPLNPLEKRRVKLVRELYNFQITAGQVAWYRHHMETKCSGDQAQMDQEMPWTAEDAFVSTGSQFFTDECLTIQMRKAKTYKCLPYSFRLSNRWDQTEIIPVHIHQAELKIWEEPSPYGKYVVGCDPAYGSGPDADSTVISIFRCYADRIIQVAEFSSASISTYQCAWVLSFLCGLYRDIMLNLEITGPGTAVYQELDILRANTATMRADENPDFYNCLAYMRHFLYKRPDSMSGSVVRQWRTTHDTKRALMHRFKDMVELGTCEIRSLNCLEEMRKIVLDEGSIQASGRNKDDKVLAAALAVWAWDQWRRFELKAAGKTYEHEQRTESQGGPDPVSALWRKFMKTAKIKINDEAA